MNKKLKKENVGTVSQEIIFHFNCAFCKKWWTIGDTPKGKKVWFCPWCGKKQQSSHSGRNEVEIRNL